MINLAIANQKGGTGKTTTTINLGAALSRSGKRVLLADLDPQASLTEYFTNPATITTNLYNALLDRQTVSPLRLGDNIKLLPTNIDLAAAEIQLVGKPYGDRRLARVLKHFEQEYDYCLIDCPPSLGILTTNALSAAHLVLVPIATELLAIRTGKLINATIEEIRVERPELHIWRIVATMYDQRLAHHREILDALKEQFHDLLYPEPVRATTKYKDAAVERIDAGAMDKKIAAFWDQLATTLTQENAA